MTKQPRIILTVGCVGKTYADTYYTNLYDWDKHTLDYKYDKTGFEHLSNEEFKSLPNRKINDGWFERYMTDWCKLIDSNTHDIITGWLQEDCINYLIKKGYNIELVLVDCNHEATAIYKQRSQARGNNDNYWHNLKAYFDTTLERYTKQYADHPQVKVWTLTQPVYLSEFLIFTGSKLTYEGLFRPHYLTLASLVYNKIAIAFNNQLSNSQTTTYTALVLNMIELSGAMNRYIPITNRQVHDMWMLSISKHDPQHKSCVPFNNLTTSIQNLDQPYTDKLNKIAENLYTNLINIKLNDSVWYFSDYHA